MKRFAQLLGDHVETSGTKQTHLAKAAGISYNYLLRLLAGDRNPSEQVVYKLAEALHLSTEQSGELLASAGYAPPASLFQQVVSPVQKSSTLQLPVSVEANQETRLAQQF